MSSRRWLWLLLAGTLLILCSLLIGRLQPRLVVEDTGPALEAIINPWLAAERFLQQQNIPVSRVEDLTTRLRDTPPAGQTLLLLACQCNLEPPARQPLLDWVRRGGHLVMIARNEWDEEQSSNDDWLLDELGLRRIRIPFTRPHASDKAAGDSPANSRQSLTRLYLENEEAPAYLAFNPHYRLEDPQEQTTAWAGDSKGQHLLQLPLDAGLVTVLSDDSLWSNERIGQYDHAWLLWYLTQDSEVLLVSHLQVPGLRDLLLRHFPLTLLAGSLLLLAGLWHWGRRQGPLVADASVPPRSLTEHLQAAAAFLARHAGHQQLLRRLQQDVRRQASRHCPHYAQLPAHEQWQKLVELSGLPRSEIREAMRPVGIQPLDADRFTRLVISLQRLRNSL